MPPPILRLAVVDDDDDARTLINHTLQRAFPTSTVSLFRSAAELLNLADSMTWDAVITNQKMPDMDGLTLIAVLRSKDAQLPIIMVSNSDQLQPDALLVGANAFLSAGERRQLPAIIEALTTERANDLRAIFDADAKRKK